MKIKKNVLAETLKVLGRVVSQTSPEASLRSIRFVGNGNRIWLSATDGVEVVAQEVDAESEGMVDFAVEYKVLREQYELLAAELRTTSQRVNLFEKVKIPECRENIRRIRIMLGDLETAAVARCKIAKRKTAAAAV